MPIDKQVFYISCCFNTFSLVLYGRKAHEFYKLDFTLKKLFFFTFLKLIFLLFKLEYKWN